MYYQVNCSVSDFDENIVIELVYKLFHEGFICILLWNLVIFIFLKWCFSSYEIRCCHTVYICILYDLYFYLSSEPLFYREFLLGQNISVAPSSFPGTTILILIVVILNLAHVIALLKLRAY